MSLFTTADLPAFKTDRLLRVAAQYFSGTVLSDDYLLAKLRDEEASLERRLRVFFTPCEMLPANFPADQRAALVAAGTRVQDEPGYDYAPNFFSGETWGALDLRQRPVIAVTELSFQYPAPTNTVFTVPVDWIRLDKKFGRLNLVPSQSSLAVPLNTYLLSVLGGGTTVPFMLQCRYTAGLSDARASHPDLIDLIQKFTVLSIVDDQFLASSGSVSADGLSQSTSWDADKHREALDRRVDVLRQAMHGVRLVVV